MGAAENNGRRTGMNRASSGGDSDDIRRQPAGTPTEDKNGRAGFGEPHPGGANIAYCDGPVLFVRDDDEVEPGR